MNPLTVLVKELPEVYQPIYGHPELSEAVARPCTDRLATIISVYDALQKVVDRPLKVLDLGCAQGFFSLSLAARGATVHGVDYLDKNIAICNAVAVENPDMKVTFEIGRVENVLGRIEKDQYDLVLGLSVFHHIIHESGVDAAKNLIHQTLDKAGAMILELALREEPLYWGPSQPEDPRSLLEGCAFVHELARHETHLAPIKRPLCIASNLCWVLGGYADRFDEWTTDPHFMARGAHAGSRRYYFSDNKILKFYNFQHRLGPKNRAEFGRETFFLTNPPPCFPTSQCIVSGSNESEGWVVIARDEGKLLLDLIREGAHYDPISILRDILDQLAALEAENLYHDDVRTWNILIAQNGNASLIDYGSISSIAQDCVWPENLFLSFFIFVRELTTGVVDDPDPLRTVSISPFTLPQPFQGWAALLWQRPLKEWCFKLMRDTLDAIPIRENETQPPESSDIWFKAIEEALQAQKLYMQHLKHRLDEGEHRVGATVQASMETYAREITTLSQSISHIGNSLRDRFSLAEHLEKQVAWSKDQFSRMENRLLQTETRAAELEQRAIAAETRERETEQQAKSEIKNLLTEKQKIEDILVNSNAKIRKLEREFAELNENIGVLKEERDVLKKEASKNRETIVRLESSLEETNRELQLSIGRVDEARINQESLQEQLLKLQEDHRASLDNTHSWYVKAQEKEAQVQTLQAQLTASLEASNHWRVLATSHEERVQAILQSNSWRITWPLRILTAGLRWFCRIPIRFFKAIARQLLRVTMRRIFNKPYLRNWLNRRLSGYPLIHAHLKLFACNQGLVAHDNSCHISERDCFSDNKFVDAPKDAFTTQVENSYFEENERLLNIQNFTPRTRRIYNDLKIAIERNGEVR
ncbi:methyltransferase domain-containing protein [Desulfatitalea alkaliphila]|uniref:Methyltransferase domain-containing protein n=1 Tax=Desulfatitalea alkaliphila TaxID=2929485 RepID=A0AA41R5J3_9BACT|nr:methyltransferase domain-containing protein [Desulfatitalea alkaliphila]MCJ8501251.1 methyltransferase domain-containing protein [Desulfatitalea alkaliphila]